MSIVIQKFGGTSLKSPLGLDFVLSHIKNSLAENKQVVIVVSAIGRKGEPYATDTLIGELEKIGTPIDPKKKDLIMSCGEVISASIVSHLLDIHGIPSEALTGFQAGIHTNMIFNNSGITNIDTTNILNVLKEGKVAVVAGFQGINPKGEITTLGRGGSDITAVSLGGYLKATSVHIFTDVPGVAVIDPKIVPSTIYLDRISYSDMHILSSNGAKVIHPDAVSIAKEFDLPLYIRSNFSYDEGTLVHKDQKDIFQKIIGITINEDGEQDKISLFYKDSYLIYLVPHINSFITQNHMGLIRTSSKTNRVDFIVQHKESKEFAKSLYNYFFKD